MGAPMAERMNPRVAWGTRALTLAMKAKVGSLARGEASDLLALHDLLIPGDWDAAFAAADFVAHHVDDPAGAGAALHDFLCRWARAGEVQARAVPDALAKIEAERAALHDWQTRKDCGL